MGLSLLAQHPLTNSVAVHATAVFFTGVSLITWGIWTSRIGMLVSGISFGFFVSCMGPTWAEVVVLLTGHDLSALALGHSLCIMSFGWICGAPFAGKSLAHILIRMFRY